MEQTDAGGGAPRGEAFDEAVLEVVSRIPAGRVMTYGSVAAALGSRASRAVGRVMAQRGDEAPWWRVVRAGGLAPQCHDAAARIRYDAEGTPYVVRADGTLRVRMRDAEWRPWLEDE